MAINHNRLMMQFSRMILLGAFCHLSVFPMLVTVFHCLKHSEVV
jgi:hypothetical protein